MARKSAIRSPKSASNTIGLDTTLVGDLDVPGSLRILGRIVGSICVEEAIHVGSSAVVEGNIRARSAQIEGVVQGNLTTREGVDLMMGSRLTGDVLARFFRIEDGAVFKGQCHMGDRGFDEDER